MGACALELGDLIWCRPGTGGSFWEIPKSVDCKVEIPSAPINLKVHVWTPDLAPMSVPAFRCELREREICTYTSFVNGQALKRDQVVATPVDVDTCREVQRSLHWQGQELRKLNLQTWATPSDLKISYRYCCYDHCTSSKVFVLQQGFVFLDHNQLMHSDLMDAAACEAF